MRTGFVTSIAILALCTFAALRPPMPRRSSPSNVWFWLGWFVNEQPFVGLAVLALSTYQTLATDVGGPLWWLAAALTAAVACGMAALAVRTRSARGVLEAALADVPGLRVPRRPLPLLRVLLPLLVPRRGVRRLRNRRYGRARSQALDVYVPRERPHGAPVLLYFHGGGFTTGSKLIGGLPLLYRLAADGWVCASANYRLRTPYPNSLADARAAVAWLRDHADELGADPERLVVAGGSAGAHLAATVALTDGAVSAAIGFYGYYGEVGGGRSGGPATPHTHVHAAAPPFLLVHGSLDTLVLAADARAFTAALARTSAQPVVLAELPGTQHNFDVLPSLRLHAISDAVEAFARWATDR
ncbi:alpha/beta hydrolase [Streptomyces sp. NRRL F-5123]|uniref:alpha/beta hydrolase n=1 Tax=Streptomyces sp. NRRL F-5123 TaxID=1463856 RepID=UPI0004E0CA12|nr:alpha/beta hydrolase [Streptomyces sp. NRRL F-5123]